MACNKRTVRKKNIKNRHKKNKIYDFFTTANSSSYLIKLQADNNIDNTYQY